jgi:aspartate/glutamate racemase
VLLATPTTLEEGLYSGVLEGVQLLGPTDQGQVTHLILEALRGRKDPSALRALVRRERERADVVLLGCTDLSLLAEGWQEEAAVVDSLRVLARATVSRAREVPGAGEDA